MYKSFQNKNNNAMLLIEWRLFGLGALINTDPVMAARPIRFTFVFCLVFIKFHWTNYKKTTNRKHNKIN